MLINILNKYDKYGFALKSITRTFYEQWREPFIEIKYLADNKSKNINSYGYPFKDLRYSFKTNNSKEVLLEIYNNIKDMDIMESTIYLLNKYPENAHQIIRDIPSFIYIKTEFYEFLQDYIAQLPEQKQKEINKIMEDKLRGIDRYLTNLDARKTMM